MFCCAVLVQDNGVTLTRRSLLGLTVVLAVAGCRPRHRRSAAPPSALNTADAAALATAAATERDLLAGYDAAIARLDAVAATALTAARERHGEHLTALSRSSGAAGHSSSPTPGRTPATLDPALAASVGQLQAAAVRAGSGTVAALLASVAAEHAADAAGAPEQAP